MFEDTIHTCPNCGERFLETYVTATKQNGAWFCSFYCAHTYEYKEACRALKAQQAPSVSTRPPKKE